jgi:hypothetical protein
LPGAEDIDYQHPRGLDRGLTVDASHIRALAGLGFIDRAENLVTSAGNVLIHSAKSRITSCATTLCLDSGIILLMRGILLITCVTCF